MAQQEKKWYVLRAMSGKEKKVKEYIENEIKVQNLGDYISRVLIPTEKVFQIRGGKKVVKERNYYPGYVLIEAVLTGEIYHILKNIPNVLSFVGENRGKNPVPLRKEEVNHILGVFDNLQENGEQSELSFMVGEELKIIDGPFKDFVGVVEEINDEKKKLTVMVKIFGRKTPLELKYSQVEKQF